MMHSVHFRIPPPICWHLHTFPRFSTNFGLFLCVAYFIDLTSIPNDLMWLLSWEQILRIINQKSHTPPPPSLKGETGPSKISHLQVYCCSVSVVSKMEKMGWFVSQILTTEEIMLQTWGEVLRNVIENPILCKNCPIFDRNHFKSQWVTRWLWKLVQNFIWILSRKLPQRFFDFLIFRLCIGFQSILEPDPKNGKK